MFTDVVTRIGNDTDQLVVDCVRGLGAGYLLSLCYQSVVPQLGVDILLQRIGTVVVLGVWGELQVWTQSHYLFDFHDNKTLIRLNVK